MRTLTRRPARRGTVMPMMALAGTSLIAMTALALDLGLLAVSRTNCQSVADAAALSATRTLDNKPGTVNSNQAAATTAATTVVGQNTLATKTGTPNTTTVEFGLYKYYDSTTTPARNPAMFDVVQWYPSGASLPSGEKSWTASRVTVTSNQPGIFSYALGTANLNTYGRAVAVYRPRDIAMTLDMTGSMKYASTVKGNESFLSCDPVTPQAGHWNRYTTYLANDPNVSTSSGTPASRNNPFYTSDPYDSGGYRYSPTNFTVTCAGGPPAVKDWFYDPSNLGNPASPVATPNVATLTNAFHHWDPTSTAPGDPDNYIPATQDYSNWASAANPATATTAGVYDIYPTPANFGDQTATNLIGDRLPRKRGAEWTASPGTWDPTATNGAAYTLAEYLGWTNRYSGGTPATATSNVAGFNPPGATNGRNDGPTLTTKASLGRANSAADYKTDWGDFRDATWEQYGYDLDVSKYVQNRPANWDPRKPASGLPANARQVTAGRFKGYVMGPGYWGKTFFMWPPDPRPAQDWRIKFFYNTAATANAATNAYQLDPQGDNKPGSGTNEGINEVILRNGTGETLNITGTPSSFTNIGTTTSYTQINYRAILQWIKQPPMCLPPNLRAGRVLYYSSIPDDVDTSSGSTQVKIDKAFWKKYIDYVVRGNFLMQFENKGWPEGGTPNIYQSDLTGYDLDSSTSTDIKPYMNYMDNPSRPRHNFWFGPITMMSYMNDLGSWAGTTHESQTWQLKAGVNSVLDDIRNNHPNDNVGLSYFCSGQYGFISVACSQDFELLKASLFYPKPLVDSGDVWNNTSKEFVAFNTSVGWLGDGKVQNAQNSTDPNSGLATCFNILAPTQTANPTRPSLPPAPYGTSTATRRGRRGASKIVIFETDGVPNYDRAINFQAQGYNSYYSIPNSGASGNYTTTSNAALAVVDQIRAPLATSASGNSGLSTGNSPARVYSIGFGDLFSINPQPQAALEARDFLLNVQKRGGTSGATDAALPAYQIITGPYQTRIDSLKTAFERVLQSGVQVTLTE